MCGVGGGRERHQDKERGRERVKDRHTPRHVRMVREREREREIKGESAAGGLASILTSERQPSPRALAGGT